MKCLSRRVGVLLLAAFVLPAGAQMEPGTPVAPVVSGVRYLGVLGESRVGLGDTIQVSIIFDQEVASSGTPVLEYMLDSGVVSSDRFTHSIFNKSAPQFSYTVKVGDASAGFSLAADALKLPDGARITDLTGTVDADVSLEGITVTDLRGNPVMLTIDSRAPVVEAVQFNGQGLPVAGEAGLDDSLVITVRFSQRVKLSGTPMLEYTLDSGVVSSDEFLHTDIGAQAREITFSYQVRVGDASAGFTLAADALKLPDGARITDPAEAVDADVSLAGIAIVDSLGNPAELPTVDGGELVVEAVRLGAQHPPVGDMVGAGGLVVIEIVFSHPVVVEGAPILEYTLDSGVVSSGGFLHTDDRLAAQIRFTYQVRPGDKSAGFSLAADALKLPGGARIVDQRTETVAADVSLAGLPVLEPTGDKVAELPTIDGGDIVNADLDGSGGVDVSDAKIFLYAKIMADQLGDGTSGGTDRVRMEVLGPFVADGTGDQALRDILAAANALPESAVDINGDGGVDGVDAAIFLYSFTHEASLGDGTNRFGHEEIQVVILEPFLSPDARARIEANEVFLADALLNLVVRARILRVIVE